MLYDLFQRSRRWLGFLEQDVGARIWWRPIFGTCGMPFVGGRRRRVQCPEKDLGMCPN
ncbi:hypothetical protein [Cellulosimicrobium sp. KWT-B]|uniref:hypothetical protein n=1 Tax=Cellulosimicrobium sp. KWT-B TaxID=1981152 RepID=UPI00130247BE|nr:hypothetical protein [Cellulosimicrobium sp. KWT-B]